MRTKENHDYRPTHERPRGNIVKMGGINIGGGSEKTYIARNGVFTRIMDGFGVRWLKQDPCFCLLNGGFQT